MSQLLGRSEVSEIAEINALNEKSKLSTSSVPCLAIN
jgi:hypothetical protein